LLDIEDVVNKYLEFQMKKGKYYSWINRIKEELRKIGVAYIWKGREDLENREHRNTEVMCDECVV